MNDGAVENQRSRRLHIPHGQLEVQAFMVVGKHDVSAQCIYLSAIGSIKP
jgi:hypothetical protein